MSISNSLLPILCAMICFQVHAKNAPPFMTSPDILNRALSNITITNGANASISTSGLYIASYDVNDCSACFGNVIAGNNTMGTFVEPVLFDTDQAVPVGQNYLYNMIYNGLYVVRTNIASPCLLPGCSWPGDDPNVQGWCVSVGVMSRHSSYTSSAYVNGSNAPANAVPLSFAADSGAFSYNYALIDPNLVGTGGACLGPIVCDDQTLTCSVGTPQNQTFQSY